MVLDISIAEALSASPVKRLLQADGVDSNVLPASKIPALPEG